jgi:hypothetical protein
MSAIGAKRTLDLPLTLSAEWFGGAGGTAPTQRNQRVKLANPENPSQYIPIAYFGIGLPSIAREPDIG